MKWLKLKKFLIRLNLMLDRSLINKTYPPIIFDVEKQRVKFFSKATGQTDPVYFDENSFILSKESSGDLLTSFDIYFKRHFILFV